MKRLVNVRAAYERAVRFVTTRSILMATAIWPVKHALRRWDPRGSARAMRARTRTGADAVLVGSGVSDRELRVDAPPVGESLAGTPGTQRSVLLAGGWGYGNLGDDAILSGYLLDGSARGAGFRVLSTTPPQTRQAVASITPAGTTFAREARSRSDRAASKLLLAGGGYLNGAWGTEIGGKLTRLASIGRGREVFVHAVEARRLTDAGVRHRAGQLMKDARVSVRDEASAQMLATINVEATVVPDAISLLYPHLRSIARPLPEVSGRVLVNLLDIRARDDVDEAEFAVDDWERRCRDLLDSVGRPCTGLAIDDADERFMVDRLGMTVVRPRTVTGLISAIGGADGLISTRMHPALLSTMLGAATWALPYCGKVRPTLRRLGVESAVMTADPLLVDEAPSERARDYSAQWADNYAASSTWLADALRGVA